MRVTSQFSDPFDREAFPSFEPILPTQFAPQGIHKQHLYVKRGHRVPKSRDILVVKSYALGD